MKDRPRTIARSAFSFLSGTLLSRLSGMIRDVSMAFCFGTSASIAAFLVALRFAILLRRLFGEGALLNGFVPHFESIRTSDPKRAAYFFRDVFFSMTLLLLLLIGGGEWVLYHWMESSPIIYLVMLILPGVLFVCLFGICSGLLHCEKYFFLTSVAPVAYNLIWLAAVWQFRNEQIDRAAIGLSIAITLAFFSQWCMTVPKTVSFLLQHFSWKECFQPRFFSADIRNMLSSLSLGILGVSAVQMNTAVDAVFARFASPEGPAYLNYAIHLQQLPLALFGIALSSALLPPLSRAFQAEDQALSKTLLESAVSQALFLILPCTAGIFALGRVSVNLLFARGDFTAISSLHTTECLIGYGFGLIPTVLTLLFAPAFYAKKDFWTPTLASVLSILLNFGLNCLFVWGFDLGPSSLAYSTSCAACVNALVLYRHLSFQIYGARPALVNFGEQILGPSALLDRSKPSRFAATSATLLGSKICCQNSPNLTAHRITCFNSVKKPALCSVIAGGMTIVFDRIFFQHNLFPSQFADQLFQFFALFTIFCGFFILMMRKEILVILGKKS